MKLLKEYSSIFPFGGERQPVEDETNVEPQQQPTQASLDGKVEDGTQAWLLDSFVSWLFNLLLPN